MDLLASQLAELQHTVQSLSSLPSIVARQAAQLEAHSSTIARLSSRNDFLTRTIEDQDKVVAELSRAAIPDGHWIWETEKDELERSRGKDGRWRFSLEKYKLQPPQLASGPPTSFLSLPVELTDAIFSLLPRSDVLAVCLVSFGLLQRAATTIYSRKLQFFYGSSKMYLFVSSRLVGMGSFSNRVSNVLLPHVLLLVHGRKKVAVASVLEEVQGRGQIAINSVVLKPDPINPSASLRRMLPILAYFNPRELQFGCLRGDEEDKVKRRVPTVLPVTEDELPFLHHWTRLEEFSGIGYASVPIFPEDGGTLAFAECLLKGTTHRKVWTELAAWTSNDSSSETLSNTNLIFSLNRTAPSDPLIDEVYLCADLVDVGGETE